MSKLGTITGKVWKFGDNINTTDISPNEMFMGTSFKIEDIVFAAIRPNWKSLVKLGDCIVAGKNFGCGSHRAAANDVMKNMGIGCIVADSVARIYYRTAIAIGFPIFACQGVSEIFTEGEQLELDIYRGLVRNLTTGLEVRGRLYPPQLLEILKRGGMMPLLLEKVTEICKR
jgi:3-isopropylmalate/(R)-2-methylmalate dehydratase small subunit